MEEINVHIAGNGIGSEGDGGLAINAELEEEIFFLYFHPITDDILFPDSGRIRKIDSSTQVISTIAGSTKKIYDSAENENNGDGGLAIDASFYRYSYGLVIHPITLDIYVFGGAYIRKIDSKTQIISTIAKAQNQIYNFTLDPKNNILYLAEKNRIVGLDLSTKNQHILFSTKDEITSLDWDINDQRLYFVKSYIQYCKLDPITKRITILLKSDFDEESLVTQSQNKLRNIVDMIKDPNSDFVYFVDEGFNEMRIVRMNSLDNSIVTLTKSKDTLWLLNVDSNGDIYYHIQTGSSIFKIVRMSLLKKYERDEIDNTSLVCCRYLLDVYAPHFHDFLFNDEIVIKSLNKNQEYIIQHLINSIIYQEEDQWFDKYDLIDILDILGKIEGNNFMKLKRYLINKFMASINNQSCIETLEKVSKMKNNSKLMQEMFEFTIEKIADLMKFTSSELVNHEIIQQNILLISGKFNKVHNGQPSPIIIQHSPISRKISSIESLFNDEKTSDIRIKINNTKYHCHKTILSSHSTYFESLFSNNFQDINNNDYEVTTEEFDENAHEIILKYCYSISGNIELDTRIFKCATFYGMQKLADACVEKIVLNENNYFEIVQQFSSIENDLLNQKIIEFGFINAKRLFADEENYSKVDEKIKDKILQKFITLARTPKRKH
ncbi:predicted protein [Naegleria gruberi]|uniref:Predicted protein n=1 Tax=Naegleria gruberi TaxID=5762 RepID=D2VM71_NAEGR|nr:uncharacterized protein NAEGRDRAFT_80512 [Naegleria gruberi]EFC41936.1 predicted protein [Naegleria gruberi]|eukprot:XP_002674680.1 predicted protein [Naegleria gruberi strain NEG-M]